MSRPSLSTPTAQRFWSRFAAFLGFVAVLAALLAPVSMLAQDVRSGKLGGVCSLNSLVVSSSGDLAAGAGSAQTQGAHCDLCGAPGVVLPLLTLLVIPSFPGSKVAAVFQAADKPALVTGLPFSRGPPFTL